LCVPPISSGNAGVPVRIVAGGLFDGFKRYLSENGGKTSLQKVAIIIYDIPTVNEFAEEFLKQDF